MKEKFGVQKQNHEGGKDGVTLADLMERFCLSGDKDTEIVCAKIFVRPQSDG